MEIVAKALGGLGFEVGVIRGEGRPVVLLMIPNIGPLEIAIVLVIALVVFGPKRLPELGKSVGKGLKEFKGSLSETQTAIEAGPVEGPVTEAGTTAEDVARNKV